MAWDTDLVLMTRVIIKDIDAPQTYTDTYLERVLIVAGLQAQTEVDFAYDYTFDISALTISPDPISSGDYDFQALVPLKAACILSHGEFKEAIGQGIKVRDGDSMIDTSVSFRGYKDILEHGPCASYERLRWQLIGSGGSVGKVVFGAHRIPAGNALSTISWFYDGYASAVNGRRDRA